jgi:uncharacterized protein YjeT (DUF2065 family)
MTSLTATIGRIIAPYLVVSGIGFLLSGEFYQRMISGAHKSDPVLVNLSGMVHFLIGATVLVIHFRWGSVLEVLVSLLGCSFVLKGAFMVALPELTLKSNKTSTWMLRVQGAGFIVAGLVLGYLSYFRA